MSTIVTEVDVIFAVSLSHLRLFVYCFEFSADLMTKAFMVKKKDSMGGLEITSRGNWCQALMPSTSPLEPH